MIEWAHISVAIAGELVSGDRHVIQPFPGGLLAGVVDGLGHGDLAESAASVAASVLERHAHEPVTSILGRCHEALRETRGAAISVASFSEKDNAITWVGVGNVAGVVLHRGSRAGNAAVHLVSRGGVVGGRLPKLRPMTLPVQRGDTLIFATDGIRDGFADTVSANHAPKAIAEGVFKYHARSTDDSLVLVVRFLGGGP